MPLLKMHISPPVPEDRKETLLLQSSRAVAEATGKPERYVMVVIEEAAACMAGKPARAAYVDVRGIGGLTPAVNARLSKEICGLLEEHAQVRPENVYLTFTDVSAANWGWKGGTFGG